MEILYIIPIFLLCFLIVVASKNDKGESPDYYSVFGDHEWLKLEDDEIPFKFLYSFVLSGVLSLIIIPVILVILLLNLITMFKI